MEKPDPVFTQDELFEIGDAVNKELRRYIDEKDPENHERSFGTVTNLLNIVKKLNARLLGDQPDWVKDLEREVAGLVLSKYSPNGDPEAVNGLLLSLESKKIPVSKANSGRFLWDVWELRALDAGVEPSMANLGRAVMREWYQHAWRDFGDEVGPEAAEAMIELAKNEPEKARARWEHLLSTDGETYFPEEQS